MSFSDDPDFANVDEALPADDALSAMQAAMWTSALSADPLFVAVPRPTEPKDEEEVQISDSDSEKQADVTGHFPSPLKEDIVEKLYLKKQLRDNAVTFKRKELEYQEMRDCTFQPNLHLHPPEGNTAKFLQMQRVFEQRRQVRLAKLKKEREAKVLKDEEQAVRPRPELSPGTKRLAQLSKDPRPVVERLLTPKRTQEIIPEVSFSYHPLVSPKARKMKRDAENIYEDLYRKQKKPAKEAPAPKPPTYVNSQSEAMILKQFRKEFSLAAESVGGKVDFEKYQLVLHRMKVATERDAELVEESWKLVPGRNEGEIDTSALLTVLEEALILHRSSVSDSDDSSTGSSLCHLFSQMHKTRLGSPSKYHVHEDPFKYSPAIDPASRNMASRSDFLTWQQQYEEALATRREWRAKQDEQKFSRECSFAPKVNAKKFAGTNPVLERVRSASPRDAGISEKSPRYAVLHMYGQQLMEERRLLSPPDREYEVNKAELTFTPRKFASISPKRAEKYPTNFDQTVQRLKTAFQQHEELTKHFSRGIELKAPGKRSAAGTPHKPSRE